MPRQVSDEHDVVIETADGLIHRMPEDAAVLLAENMRASPKYPDVEVPAADKIEAALVGADGAEPVRFAPEDESFVGRALEAQLFGDPTSAMLRALHRSLTGQEFPSVERFRKSSPPE